MSPITGNKHISNNYNDSMLPHKTMISIAQYELSCNGDTTKILSKESSLCPI